MKLPGQDFVHRVAQKLANSWSTPRQLSTPCEVARVFLAVVLWQHPSFWGLFGSSRKKTPGKFREKFAEARSALNLRIATRATIYRRLQALRKYPKKSKNTQNWTFFRYFSTSLGFLGSLSHFFETFLGFRARRARRLL